MKEYISNSGIKVKYDTDGIMLYVEIWGKDKNLLEQIKTRALNYSMSAIMWLDGQTWRTVS